jgi:ABC-type spermidine/putrescine transport systems, ATPase components
VLGNDRTITIDRQVANATQALLLIRPENVQLGKFQELPAENTWPTKVELAAYFGDHREYVLRDGDLTIRVKTGPKFVFQRGDSIGAHFSPENIVPVPKHGNPRANVQM